MGDVDNEHFRLFATRLESAIAKYGKLDDGQLLQLQKKQLETVHNLEEEFRQVLLKHAWGKGVYKAFFKKICTENGNILTSRPYFRERQDVCIGPISHALAAGDMKVLQGFHFNYNFVAWAMKLYRWRPGSRLLRLSRQIESARQDIVVLNTPLAISQARRFWSLAPARAAHTHLTYMDLVQVGLDGLVSAADKFVLPDPKRFKAPEVLLREFRRFRPMAVQRMVGNFIEAYSETSIHFYPKDKRKLYRANKYLAKHGEVIDLQKLADSVNKDARGRFVESAARTNPSEISDLMAAASSLGPTDSTPVTHGEDEDRGNFLDRCPDAEENRPDVRVEKAEMSFKLQEAVSGLPIIERKLLRLRGISL
jgi:DNA-directed RNA polymerase specialized sigma subunit